MKKILALVAAGFCANSLAFAGTEVTATCYEKVGLGPLAKTSMLFSGKLPQGQSTKASLAFPNQQYLFQVNLLGQLCTGTVSLDALFAEPKAQGQTENQCEAVQMAPAPQMTQCQQASQYSAQSSESEQCEKQGSSEQTSAQATTQADQPSTSPAVEVVVSKASTAQYHRNHRATLLLRNEQNGRVTLEYHSSPLLFPVTLTCDFNSN